jgi:hypothetical protein
MRHKGWKPHHYPYMLAGFVLVLNEMVLVLERPSDRVRKHQWNLNVLFKDVL